jgi:hypothetical protein
MLLDPHLVKNGSQAPFWVNDEGAANHPCVMLAKGDLFSPDAIKFANFVAFIGQQGKGKLVFFLELLMGIFVVGTNPQDHGACGEIFEIVIPKVAGFFGAAGRIIGGIEVEDDRLAAVI